MRCFINRFYLPVAIHYVGTLEQNVHICVLHSVARRFIVNFLSKSTRTYLRIRHTFARITKITFRLVLLYPYTDFHTAGPAVTIILIGTGLRKIIRNFAWLKAVRCACLLVYH